MGFVPMHSGPFTLILGLLSDVCSSEEADRGSGASCSLVAFAPTESNEAEEKPQEQQPGEQQA
jgi:hypothetical protein